jgi:hypothetical protein
MNDNILTPRRKNGKQIYWYDKYEYSVRDRTPHQETAKFLLDVTNGLLNDGMIRPPIRTLLYKLIGMEPDLWTKASDANLSGFVALCRDLDLIPYGIFSDDSGGYAYIPPTQTEIDAQIKYWNEQKAYKIDDDGILKCVFVEHEGLVATYQDWTDNKIPVFSCQGQIKHEFLHTTVGRLQRIIKDQGGKKIKVYALTDYDDGGNSISKNLKLWLENYKYFDVQKYAIDRAQIEAVGLNPDDKHQLDGWMAAYGIPRLKAEIRELCKVDGGRAQ